MEFHHLGIIVEDLKSSSIEFEESIGGTREGQEILDVKLGVNIQFIKFHQDFYMNLYSQ